MASIVSQMVLVNRMLIDKSGNWPYVSMVCMPGGMCARGCACRDGGACRGPVILIPKSKIVIFKLPQLVKLSYTILGNPQWLIVRKCPEVEFDHYG